MREKIKRHWFPVLWVVCCLIWGAVIGGALGAFLVLVGMAAHSTVSNYYSIQRSADAIEVIAEQRRAVRDAWAETLAEVEAKYGSIPGNRE